MSGCKIYLIVILACLFSNQVFSQQSNYSDSLTEKINLKPQLNYSAGSFFMVAPHYGSLTGFTVSPSISVPLSPKLSVSGGIIAGRFYPSSRYSDSGWPVSGAFNELSVYGSASYQFNPRLTLYGTGIKKLTDTSPLNSMPKSSYTIGSNYNFGSFSIGFSMQMSQWDNSLSPFPFNGSQGFYSPFDQRPPF